MRGGPVPELVMHETLDTCLTRWAYMVFERNWPPSWAPSNEPINGRTQWYLVDLPVPYGRIEKGGVTERWQDGPEDMGARRPRLGLH